MYINNSVNLKRQNLNEYVKEAISIAKSIHIKFDMLQDQSKIMAYKLFGDLETDCSNSRYCLNLAGEKGYRDIDPVMVFVPDINDYRELTKDLVQQYEILRERLTDFGSFYDELVKTYPTYTTYIKGCIANLDINTVENAEDGDILWYSSKFCRSESKVMDRVQAFIKDFKDTYNVKDYIVDELYTASWISNLYSVLPMVILIEKLEDVLTYKADDFHLVQYFKSYKGLDLDIDVLDRKTLIWLYGNLRYIKKNIGSNEILDMLFSKVLDSIGFGVSKTQVTKVLPNMDKTIDDVRNLFYTETAEIERINGNCSFSINKGTVESIEELLSKELAQGYIRNEYDMEAGILDAEEKFRYSKPSQETTKVIETDKMLILDLSDTNKFSYYLNAHIYAMSKDNSYSYINFLNPSDGVIYKFNSKQVFMFLLKLMLDIYNKGTIDPLISKFSYTNILDLDKAKNFNFESMQITKTDLTNIVNEITEFFKDLPEDLSTIERFRKYYDISLKTLDRFWYYLSNTPDILYSMDLLYLFNSLFTSGDINLETPMNIAELCKEVDLPDVKVDEEHTRITFKRLIESIIGNQIYDFDLFNSKVSKVINIMKKTNSYTVQFVLDSVIPYNITGEYQTLKVSLGRKGVITVDKASFRYYEKIDKTLENRFVKIADRLMNNDVANSFMYYKPVNLKLMNLGSINMLTKYDTLVNTVLRREPIKKKYQETLDNGKVIDVNLTTDYLRFGKVGTMPNFYKPYFSTILNIEDSEMNTSTDKDKQTIIESKPLEIGSNLTTGLTSGYSTVIKSSTRKTNILDYDFNSVRISNNTNYSRTSMFTMFKPEGISNTNEKLLTGYNTDNLLPYVSVTEVKPEIINPSEITSKDRILFYNGAIPKVFSPEFKITTFKDSDISNKYSNVDYTIIPTKKLEVGLDNELTRDDSYVYIGSTLPDYYKPGMFSNVNKDILSTTQESRKEIITKPQTPIMRSVNELDVSNVTIDNLEYITAPFTPDTYGVDPAEDILIKEFKNDIFKKTIKPNLITDNDNVNNGTIRVLTNENEIPDYKPGSMHLTDKDFMLNVNQEDRKQKTYKPIKPPMRSVDELSLVNDTFDNNESTLSMKLGDAEGVDPAEDIVIKNTNTDKKKNINPIEILQSSNEILSMNTRIEKDDRELPLYRPDGILEIERIEVDSNNRKIVKLIPQKPPMKSVDEIETGNFNTIDNNEHVISMELGDTEGVDPAEDIVIKYLQKFKRLKTVPSTISPISELTTNITRVINIDTDNVINDMKPDTLVNKEAKTVNVDTENRKMNIGNVGAPTIRVTTEDEIEDMPVIRIQR